MDHPGVLFLSFFFLYFNTDAQVTPSEAPTTNVDAHTSIIPQSIVILIVILSILSFITFICLIYPRPCLLNHVNYQQNELTITNNRPRGSGIDKSWIDSLPSFSFSSLRGLKEGLECVVCLSEFEDTEVLRLLPKCKHAFHGNCIGEWLEDHSNCPLCRQNIDIEDISVFESSSSSTIIDMAVRLHTCASAPPQPPGSQEPCELGLSNSHSGSDVELFVQREENDDQEDKTAGNELNKKDMHKFKHKIIVFGVIISRRWSDVDLSDIISLNSDMMNATSSRILSSYNSYNRQYMLTMLESTTEENREKIKEIELRKFCGRGSVVSDLGIPSSDIKPKWNDSSSNVITSGERSVSEITTLSRFSDCCAGNNIHEERTRDWLAIAKQTVQRFGSTERLKPSDQYSGKQMV